MPALQHCAAVSIKLFRPIVQLQEFSQAELSRSRIVRLDQLSKQVLTDLANSYTVKEMALELLKAYEQHTGSKVRQLCLTCHEADSAS